LSKSTKIEIVIFAKLLLRFFWQQLMDVTGYDTIEEINVDSKAEYTA